MLLDGASLDRCERVPETVAKQHGLRLFPRDTVLFAKSGMSAKLGRVYRLPQAAYVVNHLAALVPKRGCHPGYLSHWLTKNPPSRLIRDDAYPSIRLSEISEIQIPDPGIDEQKRIAAILDKADAIRRKRQHALAEIDALQKATFAHMFLDSDKWPLVELREITELINGDRSSNYPSGKDILPSGVLFLSTKNIRGSRLDLTNSQYISEEKFASLSRGKLRRGDIVITLRGSIGQCALFDCDHETGFINAQLMILRPFRNTRPSYVRDFLISPRTQAELMRIGSGSAVPQLTAKQIGELRIPSPPMQVQERFEAISRQLDRQHLKFDLLAHEAERLFGSLSQRAFRGEL
jgi:type I restriction enzyme S subunit